MRLIDADALKPTTCFKMNWSKGTGVEAPAVWLKDIDNTPAIDAVPVVRCRECINYHRNKHDRGDDSYCSIFCTETYPDSYCSMGQRKPRSKDLER